MRLFYPPRHPRGSGDSGRGQLFRQAGTAACAARPAAKALRLASTTFSPLRAKRLTMQSSSTSAENGSWSAMAPSMTVLPRRTSPRSRAIVALRRRTPCARRGAHLADRVVRVLEKAELDHRRHQPRVVHQRHARASGSATSAAPRPPRSRAARRRARRDLRREHLRPKRRCEVTTPPRWPCRRLRSSSRRGPRRWPPRRGSRWPS
jgi:hypothetical protein